MSAALALAGTTSRGESLEQLLVHMCSYGKPRLFYMGSTWWCTIEMNTNAEGASFDIKSESNHPTPTAAATQCLDRIEKAVKTIGGAA